MICIGDAGSAILPCCTSKGAALIAWDGALSEITLGRVLQAEVNVMLVGSAGLWYLGAAGNGLQGVLTFQGASFQVLACVNWCWFRALGWWGERGWVG